MADRGHVKLGDEVECVVTKVRGLVTAIMDSISGCRTICVQPPGGSKDGTKKESTWVDEPCVRVIKKQAVKMPTSERLDTNLGGPMLTRLPQRNLPRR